MWTDGGITGDLSYAYSTSETICETTAYATTPPDMSYVAYEVEPSSIYPDDGETDVTAWMSYAFGFLKYDVAATGLDVKMLYDGVELGEDEVEISTDYWSLKSSDGYDHYGAVFKWDPVSPTAQTLLYIVLDDDNLLSDKTYTFKADFDGVMTTSDGGTLSNVEIIFSTGDYVDEGDEMGEVDEDESGGGGEGS